MDAVLGNNTVALLNGTCPRMIIGPSYFITGLFGISLNVIAAFLMAKDPEMRNPTYFYMINLCIADAMTLIPLNVYAGLVLMHPVMMQYVLDIINVLIMLMTWTSSVCFTIATTFSRCIQLASPHLVDIYFKKRNLLISVALVWILPAILFGIAIATLPWIRMSVYMRLAFLPYRRYWTECRLFRNFNSRNNRIF